VLSPTKRFPRPSGLDEQNIFYLTSLVYDPNVDREALIAEDLAAIRSFPGVRNAILTNAIPLSNSGWSEDMRLEPDPDLDATDVAIYFMDEHGVDTLGVELIAGNQDKDRLADIVTTRATAQWAELDTRPSTPHASQLLDARTRAGGSPRPASSPR